MPQFDRVNGVFTTRFADGKSGARPNDKFKFKREGWKWNRLTKGWETDDIEKARPLAKYAVGAAKEHLDNANRLRKEAVDASWAEGTDAEFPAPAGLSYLPFQKAGIEYSIKRKRTLIADPPGLGKALVSDEIILTPSGWKPIGTLSVGDFVFGRNGKPTKVTGVYPQGTCDTYKVTFRDGAWVRCNLDHLWAVRDTNIRRKGKPFAVKPLKELLARGLKTSDGKNKWDIPLVSPVEFSQKSFLIPPYTMGVLLGDGSLSGTSPAISIAPHEFEIKARIEAEIHEGYRLHCGRTGNSCPQYTLSRPHCGPTESLYVKELDRLNLRVTGLYKHIPEEYLKGSIEQRVELLRGLMDSDGSAHKNRVTFHTSAKDLATGVQQLVWSLGGSAIIRAYERSGRKNCEYQVNVKLDGLCPFHLTRKAGQWKPSDRNGPRRFISDVSYIGQHEHVCISVDAEDHLYVTRDYTVTHNTIQAIGVHNTVHTKKVLIVCPASLKVNWKREFEKWDVHGLSVGIAQSVTKREPLFDEAGERFRDHNNRPMYRTWTEHAWPETDVVVVNYDMLDAFDEKIKDQSWDLLICDEAHLLKTKSAVRTLCVFGGFRPGSRKAGRKNKTYSEIEATRSLFLTGTPILSKPIELWMLVRACDPQGLGRRKEDFQFDFCGAYYIGDHLDDTGSSNSEELNRLMRERFMVRRDKRAVLKELPDKTREMIVLPQDRLEAPVKREKTRMEKALGAYEALLGLEDSDNDFRYIKAINDLSEKLGAALEAQDSEEPDWDRAVKSLEEPDQILFTEISLAREEVALAKVKMVVEHVHKLVESGEPIICFAYHKSVIKAIKEGLEKLGIRVGVITGDVPSHKRQAIVDAFQNGEYDVILGNILAMGVGFTLTRAQIVVFAELDWVPAMIEQAEDRAWRLGQKNAVLIQHLVVDGSIEARMAGTLLDKMGVIFATLDHRD